MLFFSRRHIYFVDTPIVNKMAESGQFLHSMDSKSYLKTISIIINDNERIISSYIVVHPFLKLYNLFLDLFSTFFSDVWVLELQRLKPNARLLLFKKIWYFNYIHVSRLKLAQCLQLSSGCQGVTTNQDLLRPIKDVIIIWRGYPFGRLHLTVLHENLQRSHTLFTRLGHFTFMCKWLK